MFIKLIGIVLLSVVLCGCNALCFMSTDSSILGQSKDDFNNPAWYGGAACVAADVLP
jgi:hypothetical protein